ncbi:hypothetical protein CWC18_01245 [Pseudoalteromonas aurantia]|uniref:polysaccharide biosynthesis C-terminal domain-containing protein n=1 Tax=Pseudoalteromonas aurantia TaxID=43654 RepID=UPI00110C0E8F|nr:polysaccharide biosynthesis C-terminal domain-containing protein [Pseudoalteromonas aurantia]TMO67064.1 hypothetical protein CWC18_01245 [Pseudoalteromonas aurantia]
MIKDTMSVFFIKVFTIASSFVVMVILARGLGAENRGIFSALLVVPQLVIALTEGGMRQAGTYFIGKREISESKVLGALILFLSIASIFGSFLIYFSLDFNSFELGKEYLFPLLLIYFLNLSLNLIKGVYLGLGKIKKYNSAVHIQQTIYMSIVLLLYFYEELTLENTLFSLIIGLIVSFVLNLYYLVRNTTVILSLDFSTMIIMLKKSWMYALVFFLILSNYKIDIIFLTSWSTLEQVGIYTISTQIADMLWQLPAAFVVVIMSNASRSVENDNWYCKVVFLTKINLYITCLLSFVFVVFGGFFVNIIFGVEYAYSYNVMCYLLPGVILMTLFKTLNADFAGNGKAHVGLYIMGPAVMINILMNYFLIPGYGAIGAAISSSISYSVSGIISVFLYSRIRNVPVGKIIMISMKEIKGNYKELIR